MPGRDGTKPQEAWAASSRRTERLAGRATSIKDIARMAHVSHPTVSRALQNSPLVNQQTAARIRRIAEETGYQASAVARGLVTRQTRTIGLAVALTNDPLTSAITWSLERAASERGYAVLVSAMALDRSDAAVRMFSERRVDGILVQMTHIGQTDMARLENLCVPLIAINGLHTSEMAGSVMTDFVQGSRTLVKHLIGLGHRRIGYIGDRLAGQANGDRMEGYRKALTRAGIGFDEALMKHGDGGQESAFDAANDLLALAAAPTAICCYNDMMALGAMRALRKRGLRVPDDVSLAGFDDAAFSAYLDPPLTTVRQPIAQLGKLAVESLLKLMAGQRPSGPIRVEAELVVRGSTAKSKDAPRRPLSDREWD